MKTPPTKIQRFDTAQVVSCGQCGGDGEIQNEHGLETCPLCLGGGQLIDIRTGVLKLYPVTCKTIKYVNKASQTD